MMNRESPEGPDDLDWRGYYREMSWHNPIDLVFRGRIEALDEMQSWIIEIHAFSIEHLGRIWSTEMP